MGSPLLTTGDVAALYDVTRNTAYKWLRALHESHGQTVVAVSVSPLGKARKRVHYVTTEEAIASLLPARPMTGTARRTRDLEDRVAALTRRLDAADRARSEDRKEMREMRGELFELQQKAREWFASHAVKTGELVS